MEYELSSFGFVKTFSKSSLEEFNVYAGRVFTEEYFIEKLGHGLPYEVYQILAKQANEQFEKECHNSSKASNECRSKRDASFGDL